MIPDELSVSVRDLLTHLLEVDPYKRMTAHAALRHPWLAAQFSSAPDVDKLRLTTPILISDKPSDDLDEELLMELGKFGLPREDLIRLIMAKIHSSMTTVYYLLLDCVTRKRKLLNKPRMTITGSMSSGVPKRHHSAGPVRPSSQNYQNGPVSATAAAAQPTSGAVVVGPPQQSQPQQTQPVIISGPIANGGPQMAQYAPSNGDQQAYIIGGSGGKQVYTYRPKSANSRSSSSQQRPLSAYAARR